MSTRIVAALVLGLAARDVAAQPDGTAKARAQAAFADGQQHYAAGDYVEAGQTFEAAYALDADPAFLFNAAQAYRLGRACTKAAALYRAFLRDVPDPPNRTKVEQYLAQSDACARTEPATPPPPVPVVTKEAVRPLPIDVREDDPGRTKRQVGIASMIAGGAVLGLGLYLTHRVGVYETEREGLCAGASSTVLCEWDAAKGVRSEELESSGTRAEVGSWVAYGIGGAALITGAILYLTHGKAEGAPSVVITPTTNGALAVGSFRF